MPDNAWQMTVVHGQRAMLSEHYADDPNAYVGIDLLLLYDREDKEREVVAPDVFVVFGVPDRARDSYKVSNEGKVPDFVLEVASKGTYKKDVGSKKDKYERMGVREYCVFDPEGGMHCPRLQLFRLEGRVYQRVSGRVGPDGSLAVRSESLGLELRFEADRLRLWDPLAREYLLEHTEERAGRLAERKGRLAERKGRLAERAGRLAERKGRLEERKGRLEERKGRLEERKGRIAAEQRVRELESEVANREE